MISCFGQFYDNTHLQQQCHAIQPTDLNFLRKSTQFNSFMGELANKREVSTVKIIHPKKERQVTSSLHEFPDSILSTSWLCCWNFLIYVWMLFGLVNNEERTRQTKYHHQMKKNKIKLYTYKKLCVVAAKL